MRIALLAEQSEFYGSPWQDARGLAEALFDRRHEVVLVDGHPDTVDSADFAIVVGPVPEWRVEARRYFLWTRTRETPVPPHVEFDSKTLSLVHASDALRRLYGGRKEPVVHLGVSEDALGTPIDPGRARRLICLDHSEPMMMEVFDQAQRRGLVEQIVAVDQVARDFARYGIALHMPGVDLTGRFALDAMAAGLPVVGNTVDALREIPAWPNCTSVEDAVEEITKLQDAAYYRRRSHVQRPMARAHTWARVADRWLTVMGC